MVKRKGKLQTRMIIYFSFIAIIPALIVMSISINFTTTSTEELVGMYTKKLVEQLNCNIDDFITTGRGVSGDLVSSSYIQKMATKHNTLSASEQSTLRFEVADVIKPVIKMQDAIDGVYIYGQGKVYYQNNKSEDNFNIEVFLESEAYDRLVKATSSDFIWFTQENNGENKVYLGRKATNNGDGAVILAMNTSYLNNLLAMSNIEDYMSLAVLDENNTMIIESSAIQNIESWVEKNATHVNQENEYAQVINRNIVSFTTCSNGWKVLSIAPIATLMSGFTKSCINSIIILILCSLLAICLSILIGRRLTKPLENIGKQIEKVKNGDLSSCEDLSHIIKGQSQEMETLINGFTNMVKSLNEVQKASRIVTKKVEENTKNLHGETSKTSELEEAFNKTIEQVAMGAKFQSEETQSATELMEVLSDGVNEVGKVICGIDETSKEVIEISSSTEQKLNHLSKQSDENIEVTHRIRTSVNALGETTQNINSVLEMVKYINTQTEMLALNASIEAVRAGSAGSGFAVIATEVRNLSLQTSDAIKAIEELLMIMNGKSQLAFKELEEANKYFEMQKPIVDDATQSFVLIMEKMRNIDANIHETNELVKEIIEHKAGALDKIVKINGIAQEFVGVTEEASSKTVSQAHCISNIHELTVQLSEVVKELEKCY